MKAMILAAGIGTRMAPLTDVTPKPLLLINNKPLIEYHIESLRDSGINEIVINVHYLADRIITYLGNGDRYGVKIIYSDEQELLDTGGGVYNALKYFGNDPFIIISADIFTDFDFSSLPKNFDGLAHLVLVDNPSYKPFGDFCLNHDRVSIPEGSRNTVTYANIGVFKPRIFCDIEEKVFPLRNCLFPAVESNLVRGELFKGDWVNVGTPEQLADLNAITLKNYG